MDLPVIPAQTIQVQKTLGQGGYGVVYKAEHSEWGTVAYKKLYAQHIKERDLFALKHEAGIQWELQHPNIVTILALVFEPGNYGVVLEFVEYGEVLDYIKDHNPDFDFKISIIYGVCLGMCYLHSLSTPIIHGDLKIENILVGENQRAKICDFGFAEWKKYSRSHSSESVRLGTVTHVPPELWRDSNLRKDEKFDVYGYGVCIWEIITGEKPFNAERAELIKEWVLNNQRPNLASIPFGTPNNIIDLMKLCWSTKQTDRPTFSYIKTNLEPMARNEDTKTNATPNESPYWSTARNEDTKTNATPNESPYCSTELGNNRRQPNEITEPIPAADLRFKKEFSTSGSVKGITVLNGKLYVITNRSPDIDVYDIDIWDSPRKITVDGLLDGSDIVACGNVLYVSDNKAELIHRIPLSGGNYSSHWSVESNSLKMSINKKGNIVVSCWNLNKIVEYTPTGIFVHEIQVNAIDGTICGLLHAIQLDDDRFLISHAASIHYRHRVCIIDSNGRMMKSYGREKGSKEGQVNVPRYLAVDSTDSIFVVDSNNNRIIQFNASLELIGEFNDDSVGLEKPRRMHLDKGMRRLYIANYGAPKIAIFDV